MTWAGLSRDTCEKLIKIAESIAIMNDAIEDVGLHQSAPTLFAYSRIQWFGFHARCLIRVIETIHSPQATRDVKSALELTLRGHLERAIDLTLRGLPKSK